MKKITTLEERYHMIELFKSGYTDQEIANQLHFSQATVRKWRRRFLRKGRSGLGSNMGRQLKGALVSFPEELKIRLFQWRDQHPGWGAMTLLAELQRDSYWRNERLPSISALNCWLRENELARPYHKHSPLPAPTDADTPRYAHDEWEMDARGYHYIPDIGVIALINLNDCYSHVRLLSYPCWLGAKRRQRHPTTEDYQAALRLAFMDWGLPNRLSVDHDTVFYDNDQPAPFPTRFHRWLICLGIELSFGRKGFPTDQAITERSHQLWFHQVIEGQRFKSITQLFDHLKKRRAFLNESLPCMTLGQKPPLLAHPGAKKPRRFYHIQLEEHLLDIQRLYEYLAKGRWFRKVSKDGTFSLGRQVYYLSRQWAKEPIEITFDVETRQWICKNENDTKTHSVGIKGDSKLELMGEDGPFIKLPYCQLHLPFSYNDWRKLQIITPAKRGTTL